MKDKKLKVCLVGSSGGHLTHLYMLKPFWQDKDRFWVTFDITHGGPSSFIMPLQVGKTPIVVPRRHEFNEHVNDHQVSFSKSVAERMGTIIVVEDMEKLGEAITKYDDIPFCSL